MIPIYNTKLFCEFFEDSTDFLNSWKESEFYTLTLEGSTPIIPDNDIKILFGLLLARYANNPIANMSESQFAIKLWQIIYQYGPTWSKKLEIQKKLRALSDDELLQGTVVINNHASNPSTPPSTASLDSLEYIDAQTSQRVKKAKIDSYTDLFNMLGDVCAEFIDRFAKLFKQVVMPENPLLYITENDEGEDE